MTNKYLEKIASNEKKQKTQWHPLHGVAAHIAGGLTAGTALGVAQYPIAKHVMGKMEQPHSDSGADLHTVRKFMKDNGLHKTTTFNTRSHSVEANKGKGFLGEIFKSHAESGSSHSNASFIPNRSAGGKKDFVIGVRNRATGKSANPDILMHELGHAKDFQSFGKLKTMGALARSPLYGAVTLGALSNDKTRDYAPAVAAVPGAVMLRDEAAANYHAYKGIKAHKGAEAAGKFVKRLLPAQMGSYALAAAAPVAGAYVAKKILDKWKPKHQEKKAGLADGSRYLKEVWKAHPIATVTGIAGAAEGAMSTTHKKNESHLRTVLRGVKNTVVGGTAGAAAGLLAEPLARKFLK